MTMIVFKPNIILKHIPSRTLNNAALYRKAHLTVEILVFDMISYSHLTMNTVKLDKIKQESSMFK